MLVIKPVKMLIQMFNRTVNLVGLSNTMSVTEAIWECYLQFAELKVRPALNIIITRKLTRGENTFKII